MSLAGHDVTRHRAHRCALGLGVVLCIASTSGVAAARTDEHGCEAARVDVEGDLQPRWQAAVARACSAIAELTGVDPGARVRISPVERDVMVEVTLADGRFAARRVVSPDALLTSLEALVVVPPSAPTEAPRAPASSVASATTSAEEAPHPATAAPPASSVAFELGGTLGGRVAAHGYLSAAPAGFAEIRVGSWLLGALIRWDVIGSKSAPLVDVFEMETVVVGIVAARRIALGFGSIDAGLSPRVVVETQTFEGTAGEQSLSAIDVRLGGFGRLGFGKAALRPIIEIDADVSPSRLRRVAQLDPRLPELPSWSAGLSAGLAWTAP